MLEVGVFHNGASDLPVLHTPSDIAVNDGTLAEVHGSAQRTDAEGWLHAGDLGRYDEQGFLYVVGRRDALIISGGENIYPTDVEAARRAHSDVVEACVFGVPDKRWGQAVAACVQLRPGATPSARDLQDRTRRCLAGFEVSRHIRFVADFPHTAAGKVLRHRVRAGATPTWQRNTAQK